MSAQRAARHSRCFALVLLGLMALLGLLPIDVLSLPGEAQALEAGAAEVAITPAVGTPLNGYGKRLGRDSLKVHDPIWARCLYLDDGETALFLVCADLCLINRELRARVLELAEVKRRVPRDHIILTATHTHSAQGAMIRALPFRAVSGRFIPEVLEATARGFVDAMEAAYAHRKRAAIGFGSGSGEGLSVNRQVEGGPVDEQIGVIRVDDSDGNPIAIVANFAAHPTTVGDSDLFSISADYPGFFYDVFEQLAGGASVALFMNGASGNQRCGNPEEKTGWARTESIGRHLALRVHKIAGDIVCGEAKLRVGYAAPELPRTLATQFLPASTVLQTLEIHVAPAGRNAELLGRGGQALLLTFFPGEACVELGLELRRRALDRGYAAQFSVGLANDYLGYFVPGHLYVTASYEAGMSFYGPRIDEWFYREFSALMTLGRPSSTSAAEGRQAFEAPEVERRAEAQWVTLHGSAYATGYQRGAAFKDVIRQAYAREVVEPVDSRLLVPDTGIWGYAPGFLNLTPVALPALAIKVRPRLKGLSQDVFEEIEGVADGAGLPFDAVWLLQCAAPFRLSENGDEAYPWPSGTMFAAVGDRAGADDLLVGCNFDWRAPGVPMVLDVRPTQGHRFVHLGFSSNLGAFAGMNEAGLVVCAVRTEPLETSPSGNPLLEQMLGADSGSPEDGPPVPLVLRTLLQEADGVDIALAQLQAVQGLRGYHVLIAAPGTRGKPGRVCVLEFGRTVAVREPDAGFLLGADPNLPWIDSAAQARYKRVAELLGAERIIAPVEIERTLRDEGPEQEGAACILNEQTRCGVVFEPLRGRLRVAFPSAEGKLGEFATVSLAPSAVAGVP